MRETKNILYCIVTKENAVEAERAVSFLGQSGFDLRLIQIEKGATVIPHYVLHTVQFDREGQMPYNPACRLLYFMTDNPDFLTLAYRLYHDIFEAFFFFAAEQATENYLQLDDIYECLLTEPLRREEALYKPVYTNNGAALPDFIPVKAMSELASSPELAAYESRPSLLYGIDGEYALFNPAGTGMRVIPLHTCAPITKKSSPKPENLLLYLDCDQEMLGRMTSHIRAIGQNRRYYTAHKEALTAAFTDWASIIMNAGFFEKQLYGKFMDILGDICEVLGKLFLLSFRLKMADAPTEKKVLIEALLDTAHNSYLDANEKYYVLCQATQPIFTDPSLRTASISALSAALRDRICAYYKSVCQTDFIEKAERDEQFVVVITAQMLSTGHGPTKTALDRCYTLIQDLHKEVKLICTKEILAPYGEIPYFLPGAPNVIPEYDKLEAMTYKDVSIPFRQISGAMPRPDGVEQILSYIRRTKPYYVISIGSGILPDILDGLVPVITIGTVPSGIPNVNTTFKVIGRKLTQDEKDDMERKGVPVESVIESVFTSAFREQTHVYTRTQLGLPVDKFLLLVVGGRLEQEVTEDFIQMFLRTLHAGTHMVFLGHYPLYEDACRCFPELSKSSTYLGIMDDVLAVNEVCDLYVNPLRAGGGTSAAEALFKGLPVVTIGFGDVAVGAGLDFHVASYDEMAEIIIRYANDKDFYTQMVRKARERAAVLTDTSTHFADIIEQAVRSPLFR